MEGDPSLRMPLILEPRFNSFSEGDRVTLVADIVLHGDAFVICRSAIFGQGFRLVGSIPTGASTVAILGAVFGSHGGALMITCRHIIGMGCMLRLNAFSHLCHMNVL